MKPITTRRKLTELTSLKRRLADETIFSEETIGELAMMHEHFQNLSSSQKREVISRKNLNYGETFREIINLESAFESELRRSYLHQFRVKLTDGETPKIGYLISLAVKARTKKKYNL